MPPMPFEKTASCGTYSAKSYIQPSHPSSSASWSCPWYQATAAGFVKSTIPAL